MEIADYAKLAARGGGDDGLFVNDAQKHPGAEDRVRVIKPVEAPGLGIRFLAWLSDLPGLRALVPLQFCSGLVKAYSAEQNKSIVCLPGFVCDLRAAYGEEITDICKKQVGLDEGKPLTARHVKAAISHARLLSAEKQATNARVVQCFLVPDLEGSGCEMDALCAAQFAGDSPETKAWKTRFSPATATFIEVYVTKACSALPDYSQGFIKKIQILSAAQKALAFVCEAQKMPELSPEAVDVIFKNVTEAKSADLMGKRLREELVMSRVRPMLDRKNADSLFSRLASRVAEQQKQAVSSVFPDAVQKSITSNMAEYLGIFAGKAASTLGGGDDAPSIVEALIPALEKNVRTALEGHCAALAAISASNILDPAQKGLLQTIALTRRLDVHQVRCYEELARSIGRGCTDFAAHLSEGAFGMALDTLRWMASDVEIKMREMKERGLEIWEFGSIDGGDMTLRLPEQFCQLALAGLGQDEAKTLLASLTGDNARQLMRCVSDSPDAEVMEGQNRGLPTFMCLLGERAAICSGQSASDASKTINARFDLETLPADVPPALTAALACSRGEVDPAFHAAMKAEWERTGGEIAQKLDNVNGKLGVEILPNGMEIGRDFVEDAIREFSPRIQLGNAPATELIDHTDWENVSLQERPLRVQAGFDKLVKFCGGDAAEALRLSMVMNQGVSASFLTASLLVGIEHTPLRLPDGRCVSPGTPLHESWQVTLRRESVDGELLMHFDYSAEGIRAGAWEGARIFFDLSSSLHYAYDIVLGKGGALELRGAVRYRVGLKESAWHGDYVEPTLADLRTVKFEAQADLLAFAQREKDASAITDLGALDMLNAFAERPLQQTASRFAAQYLSDPLPETLALREAISNASDPVSAELIALMAAARETVLNRLGDGVLRRFVEMRKSPQKGK